MNHHRRKSLRSKDPIIYGILHNKKVGVNKAIKEIFKKIDCLQIIKRKKSRVPGKIIFRLSNTDFYLSFDPRRSRIYRSPDGFKKEIKKWKWFERKVSTYGTLEYTETNFYDIVISEQEIPEEIFFHIDLFSNIETKTNTIIKNWYAWAKL